ncbi:rhamnan synthesis F family protein [Geopseudomonas aromaticivorans]
MVQKHIVVVLGMHRSGTSAITRGLQVLGVQLGDRLMPAVPGNNEKGFWEDLDVNALNIDLLGALGHDWHTLTPLVSGEFDLPVVAAFRLRAVKLVREKLLAVDCFGLKDPRISRLLPFWVSVFNHINVHVSYVIACRHPMSVAQSLAKRDGFALEKGYQLWLEHMMASLSGTQAQPRVVVDYDLLMEDPAHQLQRVAGALGLKFDVSSQAYAEYREEFLEDSLRHSRFAAADLSLDRAAPPQVETLYRTLQRMATDQMAPDARELEGQLDHLAERLQNNYSILQYTNQCEMRISELVRQISSQGEAIANQGAQIAWLQNAVSERDVEIAGLIEAASARDVEIARLIETESARDVENARLVEAVSERDNQIRSLNHALSDNDGQVAELRKVLSARDQGTADLQLKLEGVLSSHSWRVTKPLRAVVAVVSKLSISNMKSVPKLLPAARPQEICKPHSSPEDSMDFHREFYLRMYADIREAGVDPEAHFRQHGAREGRLGRAPELDLRGDFGSFNPSHETILVVSHEASLTGAPIVSLNLIQELSGRYNIVALLLGGGAIEDAFQSEGVVVACAPGVRGHSVAAEFVIDKLCGLCSFKFAIVNSIESCAVLPALAGQNIPVVSLIHEFAAYTRPREKFLEAFYWSGASVFSSQITLDSARDELPAFNDRIVHIIPQGRCRIPHRYVEVEQLEADRSRILRAFQPRGNNEDVVVVLGVGFVQLRKGVDIFIECASHVKRLQGGDRCRFVWIGSGFDADLDVNFSVYLADQVRRAGLEESVFFLDETLAIETAYEEADMLLLSSRLDPLPNVAIDAMAHGLPVLCFEKTTGIAEILAEKGLGDVCVAGYLDTHDMAEKILAMSSSETLRTDVGVRSRALVAECFNMSDYAESLERLALETRSRIHQERLDIEEILSSGCLRRDFVSPQCSTGMTDEEVARRYVRGWSTGITCRKPMPGFHPSVYEAKHGLSIFGSDPFADYLRAGCPQGEWSQKVISPQYPRLVESQGSLRVALHLHVYYPALFVEMTKRLAKNKVLPDLFISVPNEGARQSIIHQVKGYSGKVIDVRVVPNRGRDIGPLLSAFGSELVSNYDVVGHLHTKVSADVKDSAVGESWYRFLLENLLGGEAGAMADTILGAMLEDDSIGIVFPDDPNVIGWGKNRRYAESLAENLGIDELPDHFNFPVGTMFWARASVLRPLIELKLGWSDYPEEPLPYDGSMLHAIERLIPLLGVKNTTRCAVTNVQGLTR